MKLPQPCHKKWDFPSGSKFSIFLDQYFQRALLGASGGAHGALGRRARANGYNILAIDNPIYIAKDNFVFFIFPLQSPTIL